MNQTDKTNPPEADIAATIERMKQSHPSARFTNLKDILR